MSIIYEVIKEYYCYTSNTSYWHYITLTGNPKLAFDIYIFHSHGVSPQMMSTAQKDMA